MFGLAKRNFFNRNNNESLFLIFFLVILVVYIIKLISNHFSKVKQLEKDVVFELKMNVVITKIKIRNEIRALLKSGELL
jgi:hypothetical protein